MHYGKKAGRWRQCDALDNVLLGNLGSCIHVDVTVTLKTVADLILPFTAPCHTAELFRDGLRNMTKNSGCCVGLQTPQILI